MVGVPEDKTVDLLVTNPAFLGLVSDHFPLATTWHVYLMAKYASQNHPTILVSFIGQFIDEAEDSFSFHVLLDLNRLPSDRLFACDFTA